MAATTLSEAKMTNDPKTVYQEAVRAYEQSVCDRDAAMVAVIIAKRRHAEAEEAVKAAREARQRAAVAYQAAYRSESR